MLYVLPFIDFNQSHNDINNESINEKEFVCYSINTVEFSYTMNKNNNFDFINYPTYKALTKPDKTNFGIELST